MPMLAAILTAFLVLLGPEIWANAGDPRRAGDATGEPGGGLAAIAVERETLEIDLRPLADGRPAAVHARYVLRNDGEARDLDLLFVAPSVRSEGGTVSLDGRPVAFETVSGLTVPAAWQPPAGTPALTDGADLRYPVRGGDGFRFRLQAPPGPHEVDVRYFAEPAQYSGDSPTRYWQLGYVLAPARDWGSFGRLDVLVHLPSGWRAASEPDLARDGDVLRGSFDGIPADALAITTQAPPPATMDWTLVVALGGLVVTVGVGAFVGRLLGRRRRRSLWAFPVAVLLGGTWMIAILVSAFADPPLVPDGQRAWTYGYGRGMVAALLSPLFALAGLILTQASAAVAARRSRRAAARPTEDRETVLAER